MLKHLVETLFELPGEFLASGTRLSIVLVFMIGSFFSVMSTISYVGVVAVLILAVVYHYTLPKRDPTQIDGILGSKAVMFGHRGGAIDAPENTLAAIRLAKKNGAHGVEIDLSFTKDNVAITFHDDDLDRTTNGRGLLLDNDWETIKDLDASVSHMYADLYKNERVPTIDEAVQEALNLGLKIILDVKECDDRTVDYLVSLFDKYPNLKNEALVGSFFPRVVYKLRSRRPDVAIALIWRKNFWAYLDAEGTKPRYKDSPHKQYFYEALDPLLEWGIHNFFWHMAGISAVLIHKDYISKNYVDSWTARNIRVLSWAPNNPLEKDFLMHLNVSVITDTLV